MTPSARTHARRWWILAVLCLSVVLVAMDNTIVNVALPTLSRELDASTSELQWIVDIYTVCFAGLLLVCGNIGDRLGRKRTLQVGLVLFALASLAAARSGSSDQLIASRAAMGVSVAFIYPTTLALLSSVFTSRQERAIAIGVWSGVSGVGIAIGPVVGGLLLERWSWGAIFLINLPIAMLALVAGARLIPESRDPSPGRFDAFGAVLSAAFVGLLVWAVIEAPSRGWTAAVTLAGFAGSTLLLAAFVAWEARREDPLLDVRFFRNPRFSAASAVISIAFFGLFGFIFMITMYFQVIRGYSALQAGCATLPFAAVMGGLSPVAMLLVKKAGTKAVVSAGMLLMACGFVVAATAGADSSYWGVIVPSMCLMAAGMALSTGPATDSILASLPPAKAGVGSAVNDTTREFGGALGVAVVGSILSWYYVSRLADGWGSLGIPPRIVGPGQESVAQGMAVTGQMLPEQVQPAVAALQDSFMAGMQAGSLATAAAALVACLVALAFLPPRDAVSGQQPEPQPAPAPLERPEPAVVAAVER